jgi:nucleotide-binding universal stress UspA family protein
MIALKRILVATDFGEAADAALMYGRTLARMFGAELHVLHVTEDVYLTGGGVESYLAVFPGLQKDVDDAARKRLDALLVDNDADAPPRKAVVLSSSTPAYTIMQYAKDAGIDLIVMGTHGRGALRHLVMGSVAEKVVRIASCPVLTVRHPEREFVLPDALVAVSTA